MKYDYLKEDDIQAFIELALQEDVGEGDHSSLASVPFSAMVEAKIMMKDEGIIAGIEMAKHIFQKVDKSLELDILAKDGKNVQYGDILMFIKGRAQAILKAERLVLNCMQRMSGIATATHRLVQLIKHTKAQLLDTRKTTPNFRLAEKWAVKIGGGTNHRFGLFDMIMLKDNHIAYSGGIEKAIAHTKAYLHQHKKDLKIEIEVQNHQELQEVLRVGGVDVIMLDNMDVEELKKAVQMVKGQYKLEASGGINEASIKAVAETGVDYISVGAVTHSFSSLDISLKAVNVN
jgi:nicotinate-nucleotide pyrophosphorylase (carboxylating)